MTRHRSVVERTKQLEPETVADFASHDRVHEAGPELEPLGSAQLQ